MWVSRHLEEVESVEESEDGVLWGGKGKRSGKEIGRLGVETMTAGSTYCGGKRRGKEERDG